MEQLSSGVAFAKQLERWGDAPAFIIGSDRILTYAELATLADEFSARLLPNVRMLAIEAANSVEPLVAYLAALRSSVPVLLHGGGNASSHILEQCPPDASYSRRQDGAAWTLLQAPSPWRAEPHPDLAVMLSTSGSTGSAKLVRLSGRNLQANADAIASYLQLARTDRAITSLQPSYSYGLSILNSHLNVGASVVLTEASVLDGEFRALVDQHGVTSLSGVPHSYELMERAGLLSALPASVKTLTQAGGRMPTAMIEKVAKQAAQAGVCLYVMYGQTEATARIAYLPPDRLPAFAGFIGQAIPGGELWIEGSDGQRASTGEEGELLYRGPNVMMGYASARDDLRQPPGSDVLRTGDIAVEGPMGLFRITGRKSRFVKPYGLRVGLDDLEARCSEWGVVVHVAGDDELIVVASDSMEALTVAREAVSGFELPSDLFEFLEVGPVPLLANGKIDYRFLLQVGRKAKEARTSSGDDLGALVDMFRRLARGREPADTDSFESLGGDSLSYVQCSICIEEAVGRLPENWQQMELSQLRALAAGRVRMAKRVWRPVSIESDILVRCGAILLVIFQHALSGMQGGANILMVLAGFSWARFQRKRLIDGGSASVILDFARRYIIIYLAIVLSVSVLNREFDIYRFLFVSTYVSHWGGILNIYWFIESLAWCVLIVCLAFSIPSVRAFTQKRPLVSALSFVAVAMLVRLIGAQLIDAKATAFRTPDQMLLYFAAGWVIALAPTGLRFGLFVLLCAASAWSWGWSDPHVLSMACAGALMVFAPRLSLPSPVARGVLLIAAASFYIYLFNIFPMYLTDNILHAQYGRFWALQVILSITFGVGAYSAIELLGRIAAKRSSATRVPTRGM